jgi:hypothetical protein
VPLPNDLSIEAREAAGRALWARLLADPLPDPEPEETDDGDPERDAA